MMFLEALYIVADGRLRKGRRGTEARWDRYKAGRNKGEDIGVGGWSIRRDHPMKPSAQSCDTADTPLPHSVRARGEKVLLE